jgi:acyl carrier protein phosphodiesterase
MNHRSRTCIYTRNSEKMMVGNFIADCHVKGKKFSDYEEVIAEGILMHREMIRFTDSTRNCEA